MTQEKLEEFIAYSIECTNDPAEIPARRKFMEQLRHVGLIIAPDQDARPVRTGFMCKVDFDHELGNALGGNRVFADEADCEKDRECVDTCGMVEVEVRLKRVVKEDNFFSVEDLDARIAEGDNGQTITLDEAVKVWRENAEKREKDGDC